MNPLLMFGLAVTGVGLLSCYRAEGPGIWVTRIGLGLIVVALLSGAKFKLPKLVR